MNVETAATMAAETMSVSGRSNDLNSDINKLRKDVLKQAIASLAAFIGSVNYSDSFHLAAAAQASAETGVGTVVNDDAHTGLPVAAQVTSGDNPMFDLARMNSAVETANKVTMSYGIQIMSINIISAQPIDKNLTRALASGAVASAEALQAETSARGNAKATIIEAEARASAAKIEAEAAAQSTLINARAVAEVRNNRTQVVTHHHLRIRVAAG